jgi:hypothetical protein
VQSLSTDVAAQVEKGRHAKNQLSLWESFMELRIRMQRAVGPCNTLPTGDLYAKLVRPKDAALQEELAQCRCAQILSFSCPKLSRDLIIVCCLLAHLLFLHPPPLSLPSCAPFPSCSAVVADLAEVLLSVQQELVDQFSSFAEAATDDSGGIALTEGGEAEDADFSSTLEIGGVPNKGKRALAQASTILDEELEQRHKRCVEGEKGRRREVRRLQVWKAFL